MQRVTASQVRFFERLSVSPDTQNAGRETTPRRKLFVGVRFSVQVQQG
jgi:hypothetical protein